ncbi:hybrid signal transduction protein dokA isoform X2, partial [Thalictrum thalictroides]
IAVLEEQKKEDEEDAEEEATPSETDLPVGATINSDGTDGKPDINDVPMEEAQATMAPNKDQSVSQDLNETSLDLSLGLKGHDEDHDSDAKPESQGKE